MSDHTYILTDDTNTLSDNTTVLQFIKILLISALLATLIVSGLAKVTKITGVATYPTLRLYTTDPYVKIAKTILTKQGGYYGMINEYFGQDFRYAVESFQDKWGISPVDGVIGPKTWRGLALKK